MSFQLKALAALVAIVLAGSAVRAKLTNRRRLPLPPGPPGHWLFGNSVDKKYPSRQFAEWINQYGPVISLRFGFETMVVIGRHKDSVELMEKEGSALADRPRAIAGGEMLSRGLRLVVAPAGDRVRRLRKAVHTHLSPNAVKTFEPIQMHAASEAVLDILNDPKNHQQHFYRYATAVVLRVAYGKSTPTAMDDPEVLEITKMLARFQGLMQPGAMLVEKLPFLKYVPFYGRHVNTWHEEESKLFNDQLDRVISELKSGDAGPSFMRYLIENQDAYKVSKEEMAYLGGTFFGAGSDTTAVAIMFVIMAATCHPEAQQIVQDELDTVVGRDRAPNFGDFDSLPQLHAFVLECLRWRPASTLGFAHRATADIPYEDYCIPKGATVFANQWVISRDPEVYPDPEKFKPERWFHSDGSIREDIKFPSFGFGRRVCPGQYIAMHSVIINTALVLWSFRLSEDPKSPIDTMDCNDGIVAQPKPFTVCFTPRPGDEAYIREVMTKYGEGL